MVQTIYNGASGLSIILAGDSVKIVDDDLNTYDEWDVCDPFVEIDDTAIKFVKATFKYFEGMRFLQFRTLALKSFANWFRKEKEEHEKFDR